MRGRTGSLNWAARQLRRRELLPNRLLGHPGHRGMGPASPSTHCGLRRPALEEAAREVAAAKETVASVGARAEAAKAAAVTAAEAAAEAAVQAAVQAAEAPGLVA